jgi:hypothetical protein
MMAAWVEKRKLCYNAMPQQQQQQLNEKQQYQQQL